MENNKSVTAVDWLVEEMLATDWWYLSQSMKQDIIEQAKEMEKEQRGYSEEDVIKIVEKSRETGLTAEFLLLTYKQQEQ